MQVWTMVFVDDKVQLVTTVLSMHQQCIQSVYLVIDIGHQLLRACKQGLPIAYLIINRGYPLRTLSSTVVTNFATRRQKATFNPLLGLLYISSKKRFLH